MVTHGAIIYGASDDLIEVEGDINEEFSANYQEPTYLRVMPTGTLIKVEYDLGGVWRLSHDSGDSSDFRKIEQENFGAIDYSEAIRIIGDDDLAVEKVDE